MWIAFPDAIGPFVEEISQRIAKFPAPAITAIKRAVYKSVDTTTKEGFEIEDEMLGKAMSDGLAKQRIPNLVQGQTDMEAQKNWDKNIMSVQGKKKKRDTFDEDIEDVFQYLNWFTEIQGVPKNYPIGKMSLSVKE